MLQCSERMIDNNQYRLGIALDQDTVFASFNKQRSTTARNRVFGLLAAVWVSLALQPCAIAAVSDHECPHCPVEIEAAPAAIRDHCNPAATDKGDDGTSNHSAQSDCCDLDEGIVNVRVDTSGDDDDTTVLPTGVPASQFRLGSCEESGSATGPSDSTGGSVPLHVLKCVYLI